MSKVRNILVLILLALALWHFYGDSYQQAGFSGVSDDIREDVKEIKENPFVIQTIETLTDVVQILMDKIQSYTEEPDLIELPAPEKPKLKAPDQQSFSIHNTEIGDKRSTVEQQTGTPQRITLNEYGINWEAYHENYHNFFMAAYDDENNVVALFTNQNLMTSTNGISFDETKDSVVSLLGEPLQHIQKGFINYQLHPNDEYDTFLIDDNYVTIFYDHHENSTVTAIQIISGELEQQKEGFFANPSPELIEAFEYQLFDLTNAARVQHGLPLLDWEESVKWTARNHSIDMAENNYFSHTNLSGQSPFDRMAEDAISFRTAGENLAAGQISSIFAHEGLMNSNGHRENILNNTFSAMAVGVAFNDESQPYYTEKFLSK